MSIARKGLQQYLQQLQQHPSRTKVHDELYKLGFVLYSKKDTFWVCISWTVWALLPHVIGKVVQGQKDSTTVAKKVLFEQVTASPWNSLMFMLYYGLIIERRQWVQVKSIIKKGYPTVQYSSWAFWPVIGWINQRHVPLQFRVIFQSSVAMCWGIFLNVKARSLTITND